MISFTVTAAAGTLRGDAEAGLVLPHAWTEHGVVTDVAATGAHVLHLAVALCVLNDTYREAGQLGVQVDGVRVVADGDFTDAWDSTGITYAVELDTAAPEAEVDRLLDVVDEVAEIPRVVRAGADVRRVPA
jgi:hypothetical protein